MMRPIYESSRDRENQERVARKLEIAWKVKLKATEQLHFADYWVRKGGALVGIVEIKCRLGYYSTSFPTLMIGTRKILNSQEYIADSDLKFILVPQWKDGIFWRRILSDTTFKVEVGGRKDRGDPQDMEECFFIPVSSFKKVKGT